MLAVPAFLLAGSLQAADLMFDGSAAAVAKLPEAAQYSVSAPARAVALPVIRSVAGARVYDFKELWKALGYPDHGNSQDGGEATAAFGATEDELMDLTSYTSKSDSFYSEVNGYLRFYPAPYDWDGTSPEAAKVMVAHIDSVFKRVPALPADLLLFRGLDLKFRASKPYAIGEEFVDKGYVSTSAAFKVAHYFAVEMNDNAATPSRKAVFVLYLTRAEKGILIDQHEDEVILKHGRTFKVMAKKDGVKKYDLYLVQACAGACAPTVPAAAASFWAGFNVQD